MSNTVKIQAQEGEKYLLTADEIKEYFPEWTFRIEKNNPRILYFSKEVYYQQNGSTEPKEWTIGFKFLEHIIHTGGGVRREYFQNMVIEMANRLDTEERVWNFSAVGDIGYLCLGMSNQLEPVHDYWGYPSVTFIELEFLKGDWFVKFKLESYGDKVNGLEYYPCNIQDLVEPTLSLARIIESKLNPSLLSSMSLLNISPIVIICVSLIILFALILISKKRIFQHKKKQC